jgi:hypothetical protein
MPKDDHEQARAEGFIRHRRMETLADYARRGRRFAPHSTGRVRRMWAESFRRWARNVQDADEKERLDDLAAELELRGEVEPVARVGARWDAAWRAVEAILEEPGRGRRLVVAVARAYGDYRAALAAAKRRLN